MLRFGEAPFLECSSKGDTRFSAKYAYVQRYGGIIETLYQNAKVFPQGALSWKEAKGKLPENITEVRAFYSHLWDVYLLENPTLLFVLKSAAGLSDIFGQAGHAGQAEELWCIRNSG